MSDLNMMISDITTENASGEVMSYDFRTNMVCGQKLTKEDALSIMDRARQLSELEGLSAIQSGFYLLAIKEHADLADLGCKNMEEVGKKYLGIAKGPTYEKIKVATRFRDTESVNHYGLDSKFKGFKFSTLLALAKANVTNEDIEKLGITAETKFLEIAEKLSPKAEETEPTKESSESEPTNESSESEPTNEKEIETTAKEVETFEVDFNDVPDYIKTNLRKYFRGLKKDFTGTLIVTNLK